MAQRITQSESDDLRLRGTNRPAPGDDPGGRWDYEKIKGIYRGLSTERKGIELANLQERALNNDKDAQDMLGVLKASGVLDEFDLLTFLDTGADRFGLGLTNLFTRGVANIFDAFGGDGVAERLRRGADKEQRITQGQTLTKSGRYGQVAGELTAQTGEMGLGFGLGRASGIGARALAGHVARRAPRALVNPISKVATRFPRTSSAARFVAGEVAEEPGYLVPSLVRYGGQLNAGEEAAWAAGGIGLSGVLNRLIRGVTNSAQSANRVSRLLGEQDAKRLENDLIAGKGNTPEGVEELVEKYKRHIAPDEVDVLRAEIANRLNKQESITEQAKLAEAEPETRPAITAEERGRFHELDQKREFDSLTKPEEVEYQALKTRITEAAPEVRDPALDPVGPEPTVRAAKADNTETPIVEKPAKIKQAEAPEDAIRPVSPKQEVITAADEIKPPPKSGPRVQDIKSPESQRPKAEILKGDDLPYKSSPIQALGTRIEKQLLKNNNTGQKDLEAWRSFFKKSNPTAGEIDAQKGRLLKVLNKSEGDARAFTLELDDWLRRTPDRELMKRLNIEDQHRYMVERMALDNRKLLMTPKAFRRKENALFYKYSAKEGKIKTRIADTPEPIKSPALKAPEAKRYKELEFKQADQTIKPAEMAELRRIDAKVEIDDTNIATKAATIDESPRAIAKAVSKKVEVKPRVATTDPELPRGADPEDPIVKAAFADDIPEETVTKTYRPAADIKGTSLKTKIQRGKFTDSDIAAWGLKTYGKDPDKFIRRWETDWDFAQEAGVSRSRHDKFNARVKVIANALAEEATPKQAIRMEAIRNAKVEIHGTGLAPVNNGNGFTKGKIFRVAQDSVDAGVMKPSEYKEFIAKQTERLNRLKEIDDARLGGISKRDLIATNRDDVHKIYIPSKEVSPEDNALGKVINRHTDADTAITNLDSLKQNLDELIKDKKTPRANRDVYQKQRDQIKRVEDETAAINKSIDEDPGSKGRWGFEAEMYDGQLHQRLFIKKQTMTREELTKSLKIIKKKGDETLKALAEFDEDIARGRKNQLKILADTDFEEIRLKREIDRDNKLEALRVEEELLEEEFKSGRIQKDQYKFGKDQVKYNRKRLEGGFNWADKITLVAKSNMLAAFNTVSLANISNLATLGHKRFQQQVGGAIGDLIDLMHGGRREDRLLFSFRGKDRRAFLKAMKDNGYFPEGISIKEGFQEYWRTGIPPATDSAFLDIPQGAFKKRWTNRLVYAAPYLVSFTDRRVRYASQMDAIMQTIAKRRMAQGWSLKQIRANIANDVKMIPQFDNGTRKAIHRESLESVYAGDNPLKTVIEAGDDVAARVLGKTAGGLVTKLFVAPFRTAPTNIVFETLKRHTPVVGPIFSEFAYRHDKAKLLKLKDSMSATEFTSQLDFLRRRRLTDMGWAAGSTTAMAGAGYAMAANGMMYGRYPSDPDEADIWEAKGITPFSINLFGVKIPTRWLNPILAPLWGGYFAHEAVKDEDNFAEISKNVGLGLVDFSTAWMDDMPTAQALETLFGRNRYGSSDDVSKNLVDQSYTIAVQSLASGIRPSWLRNLAAGKDPYKREIRYEDYMGTLIDHLNIGIPGKWEILGVELGRESLPVEFNDITGEPVQRSGGSGFLGGLITTLFGNALRAPVPENAVVMEKQRLFDLGHKFGNPFMTTGQYPGLKEGEVKEANRVIAQKSYKAVDILIKTEDYQKATDEEKAEMIGEQRREIAKVEKLKYQEYKKDFDIEKLEKPSLKQRTFDELGGLFPTEITLEDRIFDTQNAIDSGDYEDDPHGLIDAKDKIRKWKFNIPWRDEGKAHIFKEYSDDKDDLLRVWTQELKLSSDDIMDRIEDLARYENAAIAAGVYKSRKFTDKFGRLKSFAQIFGLDTGGSSNSIASSRSSAIEALNRIAAGAGGSTKKLRSRAWRF